MVSQANFICQKVWRWKTTGLWLKVSNNRDIIRVMKRELMDILVCPVCKGELQLTVEEENEEEIVSGTLHCGKCEVDYPIIDTIPDLLPPDQCA